MDSLFPILGSGDPGLTLITGVITLSGSTTGSNQNVGITTTLVGLLPMVDSQPAASASTVGIARLGSGSYQVNLDQNYPSLKAAIFQLSHYEPLSSWQVKGYFPGTAVPASGSVQFLLTSGSTTSPGARVLADPTGSLHVHCAFFLKKSSA